MTRIRTSAPIDPNDRLAAEIKALRQQVAELQRAIRQPGRTGSYTPALTGLVVGTGGSPSNTADFSFSGGQLTVQGRIVYGSTGRTFPSSASRIGLPPGFTAIDIATADHSVGDVSYRDSDGGIERDGRLWLVSTTELRPLVDDNGTTYGSQTSPSSTIPFTWAAADSITWHATVIGSFS